MLRQNRIQNKHKNVMLRQNRIQNPIKNLRLSFLGK